MILMEGIIKMGLPISLETVRARHEVEDVSLGTTLHNIISPPHPQFQSLIWS